MAGADRTAVKSGLIGTARHVVVLAGATLVMVAVSAAVSLVTPGDGVDRVSWGVFVAAPAFTAAFLIAHLAPTFRDTAVRLLAMAAAPALIAAAAYVLRAPGAAP